MDNEKSIQIFIAQKTMSRIAKPVREIPFILAHTPHTLRELIEEAVKTCISCILSSSSSDSGQGWRASVARWR